MTIKLCSLQGISIILVYSFNTRSWGGIMSTVELRYYGLEISMHTVHSGEVEPEIEMDVCWRIF